MTLWWGEPWPAPDYRAPICENDAQRTLIPVGQHCYLCEETITEDDQGTSMPGVGLRDDQPVSLGLMHQHRECGLRNVMGCYGLLAGLGHHTDDDPYREDARKVQAWVQTHRRLS